MIDTVEQPVQPAPTTRPASMIMKLVLIINSLLVIAGGISITFYVTVARSATLNAQATATVRHIVQAQAQATYIASPQYLYNRITSRSPVLDDSLNNSNFSWSTASQGSSGCIFANGAYHLRLSPTDQYVTCFDKGSNYRNFLFQAYMTINSGDTAGLLFNSSISQATIGTNNSTQGIPSFYSVVNVHSYYSIGSASNPRFPFLAFGKSSAFHSGFNQPNLLSVLVQGGSISLYINKQFVSTVHDTTLSNGAIGFMASNTLHTNVDVAFSDARLWIV